VYTVLYPCHEEPGVTIEEEVCCGKSQRSAVRGGVERSLDDARTLGALSATKVVDDQEGGIGDAGHSGVVKGVGVA
jgi:hypothetical protein